MKTLKKIKLNGLNDAELRDREMNALNGGRTCSCSCSAPGGSASGDNGGANYKLGTNGGHCNYEGSGGSSTHNNGTANHNIGPSGGNSTGGCITDGGYTLFRTII